MPLDVSFFRALKVRWNKRLVEWRTLHSGDPITKPEFAPLLKRAVDDMINLKNTLQNGFKKCGLVPWNSDAVNYNMLIQQSMAKNKTSVQDEHLKNVVDSDETNQAKSTLAGLEYHMKIGQLKLFEQHKAESVWPGSREDTNLFYIWQQIRKDATPVVDTNNLEISTIIDNNVDDLNVSVEDNFYGFGTDELEDERNHFGNVDMFHLEHFVEPCTSTQQDSSDLNRNSSFEHAKEEFFDKAFRNVDNPQKDQKRIRKQRPRPPTVATSEEYRDWYEKLEKEKQMEEQLRVEKKAAREKKKQLSKAKRPVSDEKSKLKLKSSDKKRKLIK